MAIQDFSSAIVHTQSPDNVHEHIPLPLAHGRVPLPVTLHSHASSDLIRSGVNGGNHIPNPSQDTGQGRALMVGGIAPSISILYVPGISMKRG